MSDAPATTYLGRPRFEGSNICTWIGFKHVMYLVEEAILHHLRERGLSPQAMYDDYGLCLEIVDSEVRILHALRMDDQVRVEVRPLDDGASDELAHKIQLFAPRGEKDVKAVTGKVRVLFRRDDGRLADENAPQWLKPYVHAEIRRDGSTTPPAGLVAGRGQSQPDDPIADRLVAPGSNAFVWKWRIPYFYCHYSKRLQHSGYLRLMEEVVDLFLADRGISIRTMLDTRNWIPVVPQARVEILREALMEDTLYTVYTVEEVFKDLTYTARMDCYVPRGDEVIHTASGRIVHGYAKILGRSDWEFVPFDAHTLAALRGAAA